jgi:hypothetical protein
MNWETLGNEMRDHWAAAMPLVPTQYDNAPFTPPTGTAWARVVVLQGQSDVAELGHKKRYRTPGVLSVSIYSPLEAGDGDALALVDPVFEYFRGLSSNGVAMLVPSHANLGRDGPYWHVALSCPFYVDDFDP